MLPSRPRPAPLFSAVRTTARRLCTSAPRRCTALPSALCPVPSQGRSSVPVLPIPSCATSTPCAAASPRPAQLQKKRAAVRMATPTDSASPPSTALRPPAPAPLPAAPGHGVGTEDTRLVKDKLSRVAGREGDKVTVNKDYTTGFVESASARIFIHCLSTTSSVVHMFYPIESWVFLGKIKECCHGSKQLTVHFTVAESKIQKTLLETRELHMERELLLD